MKRLIYVMAVLFTLTACKKNHNTDPDNNNNNNEITSGKYLKKVKYWSLGPNTAVTIRELVTAANGDITALRTYTTTGTVMTEFTAFEKNTNGLVTKLSGQDKTANAALVYTFTYNGKGNISQMAYAKDGVTQRSKFFSYDSNDRIIQVREWNQQTQSLISQYDYTYSGNSVNPASYTDGTTTYTLTFDNKKNPSQAAPAFVMAMGMVDIYKANILKNNDGTKDVIWTVTYNDNGFATSATNGSGAGLKFEYGD